MEADGDVGIIVEKVVEILYREGGKACSRQQLLDDNVGKVIRLFVYGDFILEGDGAGEDDVVMGVAGNGQGDGDVKGIVDKGLVQYGDVEYVIRQVGCWSR